MGDKVSILDSVIVSIFSMAIVFTVLIVISYMINLLKLISNRDNGSKPTDKKVNKDKIEEPKVLSKELLSVDNISDELVAVLTASIAANEDIDADKVKIKSIRKLNNKLNFEENPEELVAVIAAAIAASLGLNIPDINIKSIRRLPQNMNAWAEMGRKEQLLGKL